ncbi:MAG: hypothetical protein JKZ03_00220 [Flavobacteriaceae bacterium]|nr:hypothetical protein [Flavobacteriaceae bacterium]
MNKHILEKQVIDQYLLLLNSQRLIIVVDSLAIVLSNQKEIITTLAQSGQALLADVKFIEVEIKNIQLQKKTYLNNFKSNLLLLNNLCGISDSTTISVSEMDAQVSLTQLENRFHSKDLT